MGARVSDLVMGVVESKLDRYFKTPAKITFTEKEAAEFLGIGTDTLSRYRKDRLINYCRYPLARPSKTNDTGLSSIYSYCLTDLLDFRERYKVKNLPSKFRFNADVKPSGAEVTNEKKLRLAS